MATVNPPPKSSSQAYVPQFSPRHLGYRLPAEWEPHEAVWLTWPHNESTWGSLEKVQAFYVKLISQLATYETVHLIVPTTEHVSTVKSRLKFADCPQNVLLHVMPTNDVWIRDYGSMFVSRVDDSTALPTRVGVDWGFNGWGRSSIPHDADNAIPHRMAQAMNTPSVAGGMVLEGGSVEVNGHGTMLATESGLINSHKNPSVDRDWVESKAATMLGVHKVIWLRGGIQGDATGGRIDQVARFVGPNRIAFVAESNAAGENYDLLQENRRRIGEARNSHGAPFDVVTLPAPVPFERDNQRMPASYANFYIANGCVLVPEFGYPTDQTAVATIQSLFPDRKVMGLDCREVVQPQGSLHCLTQQVPAV
jgi:agmatine deiminase